ncbi:MAG: Orotate phosphoribosyltransferase [Calditrichaeota bacterium]|nr:Orotate phosphoribosyltransferase [Calditrichota bacterium]
MPMTRDELLTLLRRRGALLEGHFKLASGLHSDRYVEKFRLLEDPETTGVLVGELASRVRRYAPDVVVGPVTGGVILAYEMARRLGTLAFFTEKTRDGGMELRRGFDVRGKRVLLIEDVVTTGGSVMKAAEAVRAAGGEVVAYAILVDRSSGRFQPDAPLEALLTLEINTYPPDELPEQLKRVPVVEPGSTHARG